MDQELQDVVAEFVDHFELGFDNDWEFTQSIFQEPQYYISSGGTFIHPNVEDESNNWGNRGSLLHSYRRLKALLDARGVKPFVVPPDLEK